jgi:hypothetical protein
MVSRIAASRNANTKYVATRLAELSSRISGMVPRRGLSWELLTDPRGAIILCRRFSPSLRSVSLDWGRGLVAQRVDKLLDLMALAVLLLLRFLGQLAIQEQLFFRHFGIPGLPVGLR